MIFDVFNNQLPKRLQIKVTTQAAANRIKIEYTADGSILLIRAYVTTAAENGKANEALLKMLAKEFNLSLKSLKILHGTTSRHKVIEIIA
jgi:uncharacterized protein YggU (UPF0235/DUF167 family)